MPHIYMVFEFANDEESAQQARHKLETWKQAFRLDKKLLYKLERAANTPVANQRVNSRLSPAPLAQSRSYFVHQVETKAAGAR